MIFNKIKNLLGPPPSFMKFHTDRQTGLLLEVLADLKSPWLINLQIEIDALHLKSTLLGGDKGRKEVIKLSQKL